MAQLDRFLNLLVTNNATALVMSEGEVATVIIKDSPRPVMKQPLTSAQILTLVREIAPPNQPHSLDAAGGVRFEYSSADGTFEVSLSQNGKISARIQPMAPNAGKANTPKGESATSKAGAQSAAAAASAAAQQAAPRVEAPRTEAPTAKEEKNDTDFAHEIAGVARFRGNALRDRKGTGAVFRAIPAAVVTVEQMGISQEVQRLCHLTKGLVLVTGPTGSGKSTTLCALIDLINRTRSDHVITIEDPIEFVHESKKCLITQRHVGVHTSSFKQALRAALREDPDIVLVGELRDLETVSMAIETAETGHLVFGTVHTSTAVSTVDRVIDQFPPDRQAQIRVMLSESLKGVICQVLCKKIGGGRVAAREIMLSTPSISNLIREGKTFQLPSVLQTSKRLGMVTMNDALIELVDSKQVEPQEAYLKATDKVGIINMLKQRGKDVSFADPDDARAAGASSEAPQKPAGKAGAGR